MKKRYEVAAWTAVAVAFAALCLLLISEPASSASYRNDLRCFPAKKWAAQQQYRPCARVTKVYEDGSVEVAVYDANGTERYTYSVGAQDR